jgi:hypothetical protein
MIALTDDPDRAAKAIEDAGGKAFIAEIGAPGLRKDGD